MVVVVGVVDSPFSVVVVVVGLSVYENYSYTAQRCVLPVFFPVDLLLWH